MKKFVNRKKELKFLENLGKVNVIFGRRRVGKTTLIKKFIEDKKAIYFLAVNRDLKYNLEKFSKVCREYFKIPGLRFESFKEFPTFINVEFLIEHFYYIILDSFRIITHRKIYDIPGD